jgi:hypothetical protein
MSKLVEKVWKGNPFELGLIAGGILLIMGLGYLLHAVYVWKSSRFGDLSYPDSLRIVIPGVVLICIGVQTIFGGFVLAVLGLKLTRLK